MARKKSDAEVELEAALHSGHPVAIEHAERLLAEERAKATYAYCEGVTAGPRTPWCIRRLDDEGLKLGGGITSNSLCGHVKSPYGWDLQVPFTPEREVGICKDCKRLYAEGKR